MKEKLFRHERISQQRSTNQMGLKREKNEERQYLIMTKNFQKLLKDINLLIPEGQQNLDRINKKKQI